MRSRKVATVRTCRRGPCVYRAIRDGWPCPVIREKSQSRAQNDSLSLSPAHDSTSLYLHFRALRRLLLWAAYFWPQAFTRQRMRFAPIIPVGGKTYGPPRRQVVFCTGINSLHKRIRPFGYAVGQDGDPRVPVLIRGTASRCHFPP